MTTVFFLNLTTAAFTIVDACKFLRVFSEKICISNDRTVRADAACCDFR